MYGFKLWLESDETNIAKQVYEIYFKKSNLPLAFFRDYWLTNITPMIQKMRQENLPPQEILNWILADFRRKPYLLKLAQYNWQLETIDVDPWDFDVETLDKLLFRKFGDNPMDAVPNDANRIQRQQHNSKTWLAGQNSPVFVTKTLDNKLKVEEGWHRTEAILKRGFIGNDYKNRSNWRKVKLQAWVGTPTNKTNFVTHSDRPFYPAIHPTSPGLFTSPTVAYT